MGLESEREVEFSFLTQIQMLIMYPTNEVHLTYQLAFLINFVICAYLMKLISACLTPRLSRSEFNDFFFTTPFLSVRSLRRGTKPLPYPLFLNILLFGVLSITMLIISKKYMQPLSYLDVVILSPAIYFSTQVVGAVGQLVFSPSGERGFPIHANPFKASTLGRFWGRHWNLWVQDWLRDVSYALRARPTYQKILFTFFISGLFHEVMFNLPYFILYKKSYFGLMILYFIIQAMGLLIEKKFLKGTPGWLNRLYLWIVVILPSPIFISTPFLKFLGLIHE